MRNADKVFAFPGISRAATTDVAVADFDGDLMSDFYVARSTRGSFGKLFVQTPEGVSDATFYADLDHPKGVESVVAADFDNDMDVDLYLVRASRTSNQPNLLYENLGDGSFRAVPDAGGAQGSTVGLGSDVTTRSISTGMGSWTCSSPTETGRARAQPAVSQLGQPQSLAGGRSRRNRVQP